MEENKEKEIPFPDKPWGILFWEVFLFALTFVLGITTAYRINIIAPQPKIEATPSFYAQFILTTIFIVLIILLIIKFVKSSLKKKILLKTLFLLAIITGSLIFFETWLGEPWALLLIAILVFGWLKKPVIFLHDFLLVSGTAGIGSFLGVEFKPVTVIYLLIIFSIYDFIAVYKTRHMIKMAKAMSEVGAMPGLILPSDISGFRAPLSNIDSRKKSLILGSGDIAFPLFLSVSLIQEGILKAITVAFFALLGLITSFWIFFHQKERKAIPALPPIAFFSIIGYLITLLFKS